MTRQSTTPFMKLTEKKRKTVTFDARDTLEKTSKNMERMMALMDKMYIKLDQKEVPYKLQICQRGRGQNRQKFRQGNNWRGYRSFSRNHIESNRGYGRSRSNFWRGNFQGRFNNNTGRTWENKRTWRQSISRERERRVRSPSSSRLGSGTSMNRDRIRCFKCKEYDHFVNECLNLVPKDSDRESDGTRSISLYLADSDMGSDTEQYLNI